MMISGENRYKYVPVYGRDIQFDETIPVGEAFEFDGKVYVVSVDGLCYNCGLLKLCENSKIVRKPPCATETRKDKRDVIFKLEEG